MFRVRVQGFPPLSVFACRVSCYYRRRRRQVWGGFSVFRGFCLRFRGVWPLLVLRAGRSTVNGVLLMASVKSLELYRSRVAEADLHYGAPGSPSVCGGFEAAGSV